MENLLPSHHDRPHTKFLTLPARVGAGPGWSMAPSPAVLRRDRRLASPPAGSGLSAGFLRRAAGQDPRRGPGAQQGPSTSRSVCEADGTKEILGLWLEQNEGAKFWLRVMNELKNRGVEDVCLSPSSTGSKAFPKRIHRRLPASDGADLHRSSVAPQPRFRLLQRSKAGCGCPEGCLPSRRCRRRRSRAYRFRGKVLGPKLSGHRPELAASLERGRVVLCFSWRCSSDLVHHKCHRGLECQVSPSRESQGPFPHRRGRNEAPVPGLEPLREGVEHATPRVGHGESSVRRPLWRALHQGLGGLMFNRPPAHEIPHPTCRTNRRATHIQKASRRSGMSLNGQARVRK